MDDEYIDHVYLNVGGALFETRKSTLLATGSQYFAKRMKDYTNDNVLFIDRDPCLFVFILSYLRNKQLSLQSEMGKVFLESLLLESLFFDLGDLHHQITRIMSEKKKPHDAELINEVKLLRLHMQNLVNRRTLRNDVVDV